MFLQRSDLTGIQFSLNGYGLVCILCPVCFLTYHFRFHFQQTGKQLHFPVRNCVSRLEAEHISGRTVRQYFPVDIRNPPPGSHDHRVAHPVPISLPAVIESFI